MFVILSLVYAFFVALYFGLFRLTDCKKKEFLQFLLVYIALLAIMAFLMSFMLSKEIVDEYWYSHFDPIKKQLIMALFYIPPTFGVAYLMFPFKIIKRNKTLLWVLLSYTLLYVFIYMYPYFMDFALSGM